MKQKAKSKVIYKSGFFANTEYDIFIAIWRKIVFLRRSAFPINSKKEVAVCGGNGF